MKPTVIVDAIRSPMGRGEPGGVFEMIDATALLGRAGVDPALVDDVIIGNLWHPDGGSTCVGRSAWSAAGLPETVPVTTVRRCAGPSQRLIHRAVEAVRAGKRDLVVVGGVESVSTVPSGSSRLVRYLFGQEEVHQAPEALQQWIAAERTAARRRLGRQQLDEYAARSRQRAAEVAAMKEFQPEIAPVAVRTSHYSTVVSADETVGTRGTRQRLTACRPLCYDGELASRFPEVGWHHTTRNTFTAADGAGAMIIASERRAAELGLRRRARFASLSEVAEDPAAAGEGSVHATRKVVARTGLSVADLDHYEIGEDFASIPLAWQQEFDADPDRLNPRGGAISLGHPAGASAVRSMVTMLGALDATGGRFGLQAMEGARGTANAVIVERLPAR